MIKKPGDEYSRGETDQRGRNRPGPGGKENDPRKGGKDGEHKNRQTGKSHLGRGQWRTFFRILNRL